MERSVWCPKSLLSNTLNKNIFRNPTQLISRNSIRRVSAITRLKTDAPSTVTTRLAWNSESPKPRLLPFQFEMQRTLSRNIFCSHNTERGRISSVYENRMTMMMLKREWFPLLSPDDIMWCEQMNFVLLTPERLGPSVPRVHFSQDKGNQCRQGEGQDFFLFVLLFSCTV